MTPDYPVNIVDIRRLEDTNSKELVQIKEYQGEGGKTDVCKAIRDLMDDSREEGIETNKLENAKNLLGLLEDEVIAEKIGLPLETVQGLHTEV